MTKADIAERIRGTLSMSKKESEDVLEDVLTIMKGTLAQGERIMISGFGNFELRRKNDRKGRNPQTGEDMVITQRTVLTFKPSKVLKHIVNGGRRIAQRYRQ